MAIHPQKRLPRFRRHANAASSIEITERDLEILEHVARHRFLRSTHIQQLVGGSSQNLRRRLQGLFHRGFLDRPTAQLTQFQQAGSQPIVYALGNLGARLLQSRGVVDGTKVHWSIKNREARSLFLRHTLQIAQFMVDLEVACRARDDIRLVREDELMRERDRRDIFRWRISLRGESFGIQPDRVFALERKSSGVRQHYFLEADQGTMPIRRRHLRQSSLYRKLLSYHSTWQELKHTRELNISRFRVLTLTTSNHRTESALAASRDLPSGKGLFLFASAGEVSAENILTHSWRIGGGVGLSTLLDG